jgi:predicted Zn-dependent protease with MMP-like domain/Tfp pilus assembly protein PilF
MSRSDRLLALVDRGLDRCEDGDLDGAARQLEMAQRIDPRHPEVVRLEATLAASRGDDERALALFERLAELVPEDATPWISAAHLLLYSADDPEAALARAQGALERVDDEDLLVEAVLLRAEALVVLDRPGEARAALGELASSAIDDPGTILQLADTHIACGDGPGARRWAEKLLGDPEHRAEALYQVGRAHEVTGDDAAKTAAWLEVRAQDAAAPWPPWHLPAERFEAICAAALAELPARAKELLADVPVLIDDLPAEGLVADGFDPRALGLIDGPNLVEQSLEGRAGRPVNIFLYQKNLEQAFADPEELAEEIRITVLHETAHYFGLDEDEVAAYGLD